jgi:hypothetical protein
MHDSHSLQLMPSPKWKLVVDVGELEPGNNTSLAQMVGESINFGQENNFSQASVEPPERVEVPTGVKDPRIDEVVSLLGEYMPSDHISPLAPFIQGFMSLRLLLLRPSRSDEEEESVHTMLDSYTSYSQGGRNRSDIALMLARDFMFLSQAKTQQQQQQGPFFSRGQGMVINNPQPALPGYSTFDTQHSPALAPIGIGDSISIIST